MVDAMNPADAEALTHWQAEHPPPEPVDPGDEDPADPAAWRRAWGVAEPVDPWGVQLPTEPPY